MPNYRSTGSGSRTQSLDIGSTGCDKRVEEIYNVSNEDINWIAFGSSDVYVVDTQKRTHFSHPSIMCNKEGKNTTRCASFGCNGSWVVVGDDDGIRHSALPGKIEAALKSGPVRRVALSQHSPTWYFIEYTDGATNFSLPELWREHIAKVERTSIQLDTLWTSNGAPTKSNVIFAFGSSKDQFAMITEHGIARSITLWIASE
ncbi:hypothetical protein FRB95_005644 [Tulasnella sp. JGI-2019a]|nr:hypothetical protein FRB93_003778 [Tulasnella sp. JGI-2019a]KAG9029140.1 hypothetical protein FRB95_005644 [Tulasnella sp. JGI-2019a]